MIVTGYYFADINRSTCKMESMGKDGMDSKPSTSSAMDQEANEDVIPGHKDVNSFSQVKLTTTKYPDNCRCDKFQSSKTSQ